MLPVDRTGFLKSQLNRGRTLLRSTGQFFDIRTANGRELFKETTLELFCLLGNKLLGSHILRDIVGPSDTEDGDRAADDTTDFSTAEATARLVPYLQEAGYELVTVSELVEAKHGDTPEKSKIYGYYYFQ